MSIIIECWRNILLKCLATQGKMDWCLCQGYQYKKNSAENWLTFTDLLIYFGAYKYGNFKFYWFVYWLICFLTAYQPFVRLFKTETFQSVFILKLQFHILSVVCILLKLASFQNKWNNLENCKYFKSVEKWKKVIWCHQSVLPFISFPPL